MHEGERRPREDKMAPPASNPLPTDFVYPTGLRLVLLMVSIFLGMFLVALVRTFIVTYTNTPPYPPPGGGGVGGVMQMPYNYTAKLTIPIRSSVTRRINSSSRPSYLRSPRTSPRRAISAGTARHTCSPTAPSCRCMGRCIPSSTSRLFS